MSNSTTLIACHPTPLSPKPLLTLPTTTTTLRNGDNPSLLLLNRRDLFASLVLSSITTQFFYTPLAHARGLFQMPPARLTNRYFLVRAGESEYETLGIINTNPVAKTSVDNGLSEIGKKQTVRSALELKKMGACDGSCWIWPSITQRAYQAAEIIAAVNGTKIEKKFNLIVEQPQVNLAFRGKKRKAESLSLKQGTNKWFDVQECAVGRIVPEYSFLDARGLGAYEGRNLESISEVYELDSLSQNAKPPPIADGTPNESVSDVFVRVTQLMSILETQYSEDTVVIVSPDSDNLTILQAGLVGLDLRRHRELSFGPGEVRYVDASSIPAYKQPASAVYKCLNPPSCT